MSNFNDVVYTVLHLLHTQSTLKNTEDGGMNSGGFKE